MNTGEAIQKHIKRLTDANLSFESIAEQLKITDSQILELSENAIRTPSPGILERLIKIQTPKKSMNDSDLKLELSEIAAAHQIELKSSDTAQGVKDKLIALACPPLSVREKKYVISNRDTTIRELKLSGRLSPVMHNFLVSNYADHERLESGDIVLSETMDRQWNSLIEFASQIPEDTFKLSEKSQTGIQTPAHISLSSSNHGENPMIALTEKRVRELERQGKN